MKKEFMHIGIPVSDVMPGMVYNEKTKMWRSNPMDHEYRVEFMKYEEGTPFPEILHKKPHVAYKVDSLESCIEDADELIYGPVAASSAAAMLAFIIKDGVIIEIFEEK